MSRTKRWIQLAMLSALAILFHMIEAMIPIPLPIPGFKLGLANIVGLIALYQFDGKAMLLVNVLRVLIASLLRGIIFGTPFWLSITGVLLSSFLAIWAKKHTPLSVYGVSMVASVFHCIGQMIAVTFIYQQYLMGALLPLLMVLSVPTGILIGYFADQVQRRIA